MPMELLGGSVSRERLAENVLFVGGEILVSMQVADFIMLLASFGELVDGLHADGADVDAERNLLASMLHIAQVTGLAGERAT